MSPFVRKIPNILTVSRLFLIPLFVFLLTDPSEAMVTAATWVFIFAACTDWIDGFLARRYRAVTDTGKLLDPLADKILVMSALVMLTAQRSEIDGSAWLPGWITVTVIAREIWVTGVRGVAAARGIILAAREAGKLKSFLQMVGIPCLLLTGHVLRIGPLTVSCQMLGLNLLFFSIIIGYWGAYEYTMEVLTSAPGAPLGDADSEPAGPPEEPLT